MKIYIGADHRGFEFKEEIVPWLRTEGYQVIDCGNDHFDVEDDYPDFAIMVAQHVAEDESAGQKDVLGIVICGSGVGVNISANKVKGARASTAISVEEVEHGRRNDNLNILSISAQYSSLNETKSFITAFLNESFLGAERHKRRLKKIADFEKRN